MRPSKHGKPRGDKELEVGWPRYSGWHSLASFGITENVKVSSCVHSFLASTNAAALFSSVQFYQVLVFSCRPNRSWFHLPAKKNDDTSSISSGQLMIDYSRIFTK